MKPEHIEQFIGKDVLVIDRFIINRGELKLFDNGYDRYLFCGEDVVNNTIHFSPINVEQIILRKYITIVILKG